MGRGPVVGKLLMTVWLLVCGFLFVFVTGVKARDQNHGTFAFGAVVGAVYIVLLLAFALFMDFLTERRGKRK